MERTAAAADGFLGQWIVSFGDTQARLIIPSQDGGPNLPGQVTIDGDWIPDSGSKQAVQITISTLDQAGERAVGWEIATPDTASPERFGGYAFGFSSYSPK